MEPPKLDTHNGIEDLIMQLKDLITGRHHVTKKPFSDGSDLKDPDVSHLLILIYAELVTRPEKWKTADFQKMVSRRKNNQLGRPINHNLAWELADLTELDRLFKRGTDPVKLGDLLGRSTGSVIARLGILGLITDDEQSVLREQLT